MNEVYIDGVNVAECPVFDIDTNKCMDFYCDSEQAFIYCKELSHCLFKQLQRLKAENEHLKEQLKKINIINETVVMNVDKCFICLKKRNYVDNWQNCKLKCSYKYAKRKNNESIKYHQALEEIQSYCNECNLKADDTACEILAIIDEVLNNVE